MSQQTSIEAAKARIQRLVEEIAALSRQEMRSEEFFPQFLQRVTQATDAKGGAVWLVAPRAGDGKSEFQLVAQLEMESSGFQSNEVQHAFLIRTMTETVQTKKPSAIAPEAAAPPPGSLEAQMAQMQGTVVAPTGNKCAYPIFHIPLFLKEQVVGVLQVWLQPYVVPANFNEFITFLSSLAQHVEKHLHSRRLGSLVLENQRLQQVLKFTSDLAGSLDPLEVSRLAANYGRDLIGCERCSVLSLRGDQWDVVAIAGQEVVEKKSSMVKAMAAFIGAHARPAAFRKHEANAATGGIVRHELLVLSKKELLARAEAAEAAGNGSTSTTSAADSAVVYENQRTDEIDLAYFEHSHVVSAAIAPMFNEEQDLIGAYFAESTTEGFFESPASGRDSSGAQRLTEWLALHTGKSLRAAQDYRSLPFLAVTKGLRDTHLALTGHHRKRVWLKTGIFLAVLVLVAIYPKLDKVEGNCLVTAEHRAVVVPEVAGRVEKVLVREGSHVTKGQPVAQLDTSRMEVEIEVAQQEEFRSKAEEGRLRGLGNEAEAQVAMLQASVSAKNIEKLKKDLEGATLRSPIDGVVLTKDLELHAGEFVQPGTPFAEVADLSSWDLVVDVPEDEVGEITRALAKGQVLTVNYILYSQSAQKLEATLKDASQLSAMAYPKEKENVFLVTCPNIQVPDEMRKDLRPGLTGRGKILLQHEPLAWWVGSRIVNWVRLKLIH